MMLRLFCEKYTSMYFKDILFECRKHMNKRFHAAHIIQIMMKDEISSANNIGVILSEYSPAYQQYNVNMRYKL